MCKENANKIPLKKIEQIKPVVFRAGPEEWLVAEQWKFIVMRGFLTAGRTGEENEPQLKVRLRDAACARLISRPALLHVRE